jgi:hypothetical protein
MDHHGKYGLYQRAESELVILRVFQNAVSSVKVM